MNDKNPNLTRLCNALQPDEDCSPAEMTLHWRYIDFMLDYCAPELRELLVNHNHDVVFPEPDTVREAFRQANGGKGFWELVRELEGGAAND